jgi:ribosomal protein S18 acetylase RimI-like enzyme
MRIDDLRDVYAVQQYGFDEEYWEPIETFRQILEAYPDGSFVAELNNKIVAYTISQPADEDREDLDSGLWDVRGDEECLYLHDMCLTIQARGKGIAQELFANVKLHAEDRKFKKIIGIAVQDSEKFWEKMGFNMGREYRYLGHSGTFMYQKI